MNKYTLNIIVSSDSFRGKYGSSMRHIFSDEVAGYTKMGVITKTIRSFNLLDKINDYDNISINCKKI